MVLKHVEEHGKYVEITGFKNVQVENPEELLKTIRSSKQANVSVQFFNAQLIATWEHLYFAVLNALTAFRTERNVSKSLAVEVMLYASAQRQIRKAIELVGVKSGCGDMAVVVVGEKPADVEDAVSAISRLFAKKPDERVLELSTAKAQEIRKAFTITETELEVVTKKGDAECALVDLVIERMALLSTRL
jgi:KEOPS complex subunit Cgi121